MKHYSYQSDFFKSEIYDSNLIAGIDEAGRGPLAGPVVASCAIVDPSNYPAGINDSKKLSAKKRQEIFLEIKRKVKFGIGIVDHHIIDNINILQATKLAMFLAYEDIVAKYEIKPELLLVDGNFIPFQIKDHIKEIIPIIKGDQKNISIACASIVAKCTRDNLMSDYHIEYPNYDFKQHSGYPTKSHIEKLQKFGPCEIHRKSFEPVKGIINANH